MKLSDELLEHTLAWLRSNGVDPSRIPSDPYMRLRDGVLTTELWAGDAEKRMVSPHNRNELATTVASFPIEHPPPADVADWLSSLERVNLAELEGLRLAGDEDGGVGIDCMADECWTGGQPLAYYAGYGMQEYSAYKDVPEVIQAATVADLLLAGIAHRRSKHG